VSSAGSRDPSSPAPASRRPPIRGGARSQRVEMARAEGLLRSPGNAAEALRSGRDRDGDASPAVPGDESTEERAPRASISVKKRVE
jgi:hypothetical protein